MAKERRPPILHVAPFLWSGAGGVITRLCEAQRRHGAVAIVTAHRNAGLEDWTIYRRRLKRAGVAHHAIDFFHRGESTFWASTARLADLIRDLKPAVIHAHAGVPSCGAVVARGASGHRALLIGQMYSWGPERPAWMNHQDAWGLAQTDRVVCSAHAYWDRLVAHGVPPRKMTYLPWGLPLERLEWRDRAAPRTRPRAPRIDSAPRTDGPLIGFVGRIEPRKGQLALVEAFARLRRARPAARLELVGPVADEGYGSRIRAAIADRDLGDAVTLKGEVRDVAAQVRRWDFFVSLSSDEGQGLAVLEAMAIGVPVVALEVAGLSDFVVDGRTGVIIRSPAAGTVAAAIVRLWEQPALRRRVTRGARRLVERRYAWDHTVQAFERLYWH
jgi:glycosyltransferase involved in cell wall biosynthesis